MTDQHHPLTDEFLQKIGRKNPQAIAFDAQSMRAGYDLGVADCWAYLYYELGKKDLADEMDDWVSSQRKPQSTQEDN